VLKQYFHRPNALPMSNQQHWRSECITDCTEHATKHTLTNQDFSNSHNKSSPKSFGKSVSLPPHQRMHSPTACASFTMRNTTKLLPYVTEALQSITGRNGSIMELLRSIMERYRALLNITGALWRRCRMLRGVMETLRKCYGALTEHYRTITKKHRFCPSLIKF